MAPTVPTEQLAHRESKARPEHKVRRAKPDLLVRKAHKVLWGLKALRVRTVPEYLSWVL
jgi:hypothetical protein